LIDLERAFRTFPLVTTPPVPSPHAQQEQGVYPELVRLQHTAQSFSTSAKTWMQKFSHVLSLSMEEIAEVVTDREKYKVEISLLKKMVNELKTSLAHQEILTDLIQEQAAAIEVLNETCHSCFEELNHVVSMGLAFDELNLRLEAAVQDDLQKAATIQHVSLQRDKLEADLKEQAQAALEQSSRRASDLSRLRATVEETRRIARELYTNFPRTETLRLQGAVEEILEILRVLGADQNCEVDPSLAVRIDAEATARQEALLLKRQLADAQTKVRDVELAVKQARDGALAQRGEEISELQQKLLEAQGILMLSSSFCSRIRIEVAMLHLDVEAAVKEGRDAALADRQEEVLLLEQRLRESQAQLRSEMNQREGQTTHAKSRTEDEQTQAQANAKLIEEMRFLRSQLSGLQDKSDGDMQEQLRKLEEDSWKKQMALDASAAVITEKQRLIAGVEESLRVHKGMLQESDLQVADLTRRLKECEDVLVVTKTALLEAENNAILREKHLPVAVSLTIGLYLVCASACS